MPITAPRSLILLVGFAAPALAQDARTPIRLDPEVRSQLREEMRGHMEALDDIIAALAAGDFPHAAGAVTDVPAAAD
ncbi:MAG: hypothetical protein AB1918_17455 [Pseudomonadota bacterium]